MDDIIVLGKVIGFFGVKGWVKVHSHTDPRENIVSYKEWILSDSGTSTSAAPANRRIIKVLNGKRTGKNIVAQLDGITSRELAAPLMGMRIQVERSAMPALNDDEVYWADLVGCVVTLDDGSRIGVVKRLFETGANDVMVVSDERDSSKSAGKDGRKEDILIPWVRPDVVKVVDVEARSIVVDWDPDY